MVQLDDSYLSGDYVSMSTAPASIYGNWDNVFNGVIGVTGSEDDYISPVNNGDLYIHSLNTYPCCKQCRDFRSM